MKPGEIITLDDKITLNEASKIKKIKVSNTGDRPIQVGVITIFLKVTNFCHLIENSQKECV